MAAWKKGPLAALVSRVFPPFGGLFLGKPERFVSQTGKLAGFDFAHSPPCDHKVPGLAFRPRRAAVPQGGAQGGERPRPSEFFGFERARR